MFEDQFALSPINFFQISFDCHFLEGPFPKLAKQKSSKYRLPDLSDLCAEDSFAEVSLAWNSSGIEVLVSIDKSFEQCQLPDVTKGDSVELFIDTRDVKTSGHNTRFCHHFFFLPESIDGVSAGEITRFRTEDTHELANGNDLRVKSIMKAQNYLMQIFIPGECLVGYDPDQFDRMGFSYRINRYKDLPQHFSAVTQEFQIEQQPSLWSSAKLVK